MRTHVAAIFSLAFAATAGCQGKLTEIIPKDLSAHVSDAGDAGSMTVDLGPTHFFPDIQADLDAPSGGLSCTSSACHGGGTNQPVLKPMPTTDADRMANYMAFVAECNTADPPQSNIILNALGNGHSGGVRFTMSDPQYDRWVSWIAGGELQ